MNTIVTSEKKRIIAPAWLPKCQLLVIIAVTMLYFNTTSRAQNVNSLAEKNTEIIYADTVKQYNDIASIGDFVWIDDNKNGVQDPSEPGVPNILVILYDTLLNKIDSRYTDNNGQYHFEKIPLQASGSQSFIVGFFNIPPNFAYTTQAADENNHALTGVSKPNPITGRTRPFNVNAGEIRNDIDGGLKKAPGIVMPLTIDQFSGTYADGYIQLGWNTFTEINVAHFNIERSTDGANFRQIGKVETVNEETEGTINYSYLDITAQRGTIYYRLAIVDQHGNYIYSKSIMVAVDIKGISVMIVYPNPFSKRVQIRVSSDKEEKVVINILNNSGTLMRMQNAQLRNGDNNIQIQNVDELPGGIYIIEVVSATRRLRTKVIKLD